METVKERRGLERSIERDFAAAFRHVAGQIGSEM